MSNPFTGILALGAMLVTQALDFSPETQIPWVREYKPAKGAHMIKINNAPDFDIQPYVVEELASAKEVFNTKNRMQLVLNAGYFDPNNGKTISYVIKDKETILDPMENEALTENPELQPHLDKILNRGEFRVLTCDRKKTYDIAFHNDPIDEQCELIHSIQAGPILGKDMDLEKEYFVIEKDGIIERDSISATQKTARTAVGIKGTDVYLFVVTNEKPMTIEELSAFMQKKRMDKAIAFDGGSSTSLEFGDTSITSTNDETGRKVKSFLIIKREEYKSIGR